MTDNEVNKGDNVLVGWRGRDGFRYYLGSKIIQTLSIQMDVSEGGRIQNDSQFSSVWLMAFIG